MIFLFSVRGRLNKTQGGSTCNVKGCKRGSGCNACGKCSSHSNADHKIAQLKMAEMYKQGDTIEQDYHKTNIWTKKLTKKKDDLAQYNLGVLFQEGLGVRHDRLEASKWFILSSNQGNAEAIYKLGEMKFYGHSFDRNKKEAFGLYYKAAIGGSIGACYGLGEAYWNGDGVKQDRKNALKVYDYAARQGNSDARYTLGQIYEEGQFMEVDHAKAANYYSTISSMDDPVLAFLLAVKFVNGHVVIRDSKKAYSLFKAAERGGFLRGYLLQTPITYNNIIPNYHSLIDMFIELSERGIDNLEYNIGYAYEYGIYSNTMDEVFPKDYKKASQWYTISANKGDARALYRLGIVHDEGKGTEKNLTIALDCYRKAADSGNVEAKYRLACIYLAGYSIPQDIIKAYFLFSEAANMGHSKSRRALMFSDDTKAANLRNRRFTPDREIVRTEEDQIGMLETMAGQGLVAVQYQLGKLYQNKNNPAAIKWLTLAAQNGISDACYRLGVLYEEGTYNQQNYEMAMELYERASIGEHEDAIYRLAKMHQLGKGTPINYTKAYDLYLLASEMGHNLASKALDITGDIYESPMGTIQEITFNTTSQEYEQSLFMCEHVAEQGNLELQYKLGTVYEYRLKEPNYSKTLKWYHMAASKSHREATYRLGTLYEKGLGVDQDYKKAIHLFEQAKSMNSSDAIFRLGRVYQYGYGVDVDSLKAVEYYTLVANKT
ncbi:HCP-like protein [Backusella circina FSU 941]|nr:HCP-like protein [Backusella circina FSU 941]